MDIYIGSIFLFAGTFAPQNFQYCWGQTLSISQYQALFAILGTAYGGNGTTNFQLPDLRGRVPLGVGTGIGVQPVTLGESGGTQTVTLTLNNMPSHNHLLMGDQNTGTKEFPGPNHIIAGASGNINTYSVAATPNTNLNPTKAISNTGNNQPFSIQNPYLGLNYIICINGIFPSRN